MAKRYLLGVDDTRWSLHALNTLKTFIKQDRKLDLPVTLYILHVSAPPVTQLYRAVLSEKSQKKLEDHSEVAGTKLLSYYYSVAEELTELGVEIIVIRAIGKPVDMINRAVEQYHIDEIVLGKGGSTFLMKTFLGSICKAVMESCDCPTVLIVKRPPTSWIKSEQQLQITEELLKQHIEDEKIGKRIYTEEIISDLFPFARYVTVKSPEAKEKKEGVRSGDKGKVCLEKERERDRGLTKEQHQVCEGVQKEKEERLKQTGQPVEQQQQQQKQAKESVV